VSKSLNTLSYAIKFFPNAPGLELLNNPKEFIIRSNKMKYKTENPKDITNDQIAERIIKAFIKDNDLEMIISELIVNDYVKTNPKDQSLWSSDSARYNYIFKELLNDKNKTQKIITQDITEGWKKDNEGKIVTIRIIEPVKKYLNTILTSYITDIADEMENNVDNIDSHERSIMVENQRNASAVIKRINSKKFDKCVLRLMAKNFKLVI
jgi:hypothetical protein